MLGIGLELTGCGAGGIVNPGGSGAASLDLNFLTATADTLDSRVTFSRAGQAYQYDSTGTIISAPHNLLTSSQDFTAAAFVKTNCTATGSVTTAPDGTTTGGLVTGTGATVHISQAGVVVPTSARMTLSVYAKQGGGGPNTFMRLRIASGAEVASQWINLATGGLGTTTSTANIIITSPTATDAGGGWWRVSAVLTITGFTSMTVGAGPATANSNGGALGDTAYFWGMQCELHPSVRPYLNTSVKNLLGFSEALDNAAWSKSSLTTSANVAISPSGLVDADKLIPNSGSVTGFTSQTITYAASTTYTLSVYGKAAEFQYLRLSFGLSGIRMATFDLVAGTVNAEPGLATPTMTDVGSGWYRCAISMASGAGGSVNAAFTVNGAATYAATALTGNASSGLLVWGAQLSASGSLDTYVPTVAAAPSSAVYYGPRLGYDPTTLAARGLLIEEARTNLITNSINLAYTPWSLANIFARTPNVGLAPDGTYAAALIEDNSTAAAQYVDAGITVANDSNWVTWSLFVKAGTSDLCHLRAYLTGGTVSLGSGVGVNFTFSTKTLAAPTGTGGQGTPTASDVGYVELPNGWFRLWVRIQNNSTGNVSLTCRIFPANASTATTGTLYVWGAQAEVGTFPSSHVPTIPTWTGRASAATYHDSAGVLQTAASGAARTTYRYSGSAWVYAGQALEFAMTNQMPGTMTGGTYWQGAGTTIATGQTAPDGTTNGLLLTESAGGVITYGASPLVGVVGSMTAGVPVTASIFAKAGTCSWLRFFLCDSTSPTYSVVGWFNLSTGALGTLTAGGGATLASYAIQNVGNGFYRCSVSGILSVATSCTMLIRMASADAVTTDAGSKTMTVFGPQLEVNASATSYIPTTTAAASRVADSTTVATATRAAELATIQPLGSWFNAAEGTFAAEVEVPYQTLNATTGVSFGVSEASFNNVEYISHSTTADSFTIQSGGVQQASLTFSTPPLIAKKVAGVYRVNDFAASRNGAAVSTDTSGAVPVSQVVARVGSAPWTTGNYLNGYVRRVRVYRSRLANVDIPTLST
jgi:hypothetical protein